MAAFEGEIVLKLQPKGKPFETLINLSDNGRWRINKIVENAWIHYTEALCIFRIAMIPA